METVEQRYLARQKKRMARRDHIKDLRDMALISLYIGGIVLGTAMGIIGSWVLAFLVMH